MERRRFTREFKLEAVKLVTDRGVTIAQASRDLEVNGTVLRRWVKEFGSDPQQAFPGHGQQKADQAEITRLRREVAKLKAERDILKTYGPPRPQAISAIRSEQSASTYPACGHDPGQDGDPRVPVLINFPA